ncbi:MULTISPECIES: hypothetical protein [unclassified Methylobacterium]|uniref:hypothetical protein n=1 Tax=unclassified Methylobacterium TaxID=2615210 RepID=UPI00226A03C8|nr:MULTISPECIES: hypothetical protein [unclassified Methylobacterium]
MIDPIRRKVRGFDSESERTVITVLSSFSTVRAIHEQVKREYTRDGVRYVHFIDLVVEHRCGHRKAYAIKATRKDALDDDIPAKLRLLSDQDSRGFADDYRMATFEGLCPATVHNASLIARCGREQDHEAWEAVRAILTEVPAAATAAEIGNASGLGVRGMRAAFALIPAGDLRNPPGIRLNMDTPLTNRAGRETTNQAA